MAEEKLHVEPHLPGRILLTQAQIEARARELGALISGHYRGERPLFLGVMNGALFFLADLLRAVEIETEITCIRLASYADTQSTGVLRGLEGLTESVLGRRILVVDDILDTGFTLGHLTQRLRERGAAEVKICVLLQKNRPRKVAIHADWIGFEIDDAFVVGYGLDHNGRHRGLRDIRVLESPVPAPASQEGRQNDSKPPRPKQ
jgi:hypoxanthine phosphoribosyltransferase